MANNDIVFPHSLTNRDKPGKTANSATGPLRRTRYGELVTADLYGGKQHGLSDEGSYFLCRNATPGTGIAGHADSTSVDDTKPLLFLRNGASQGEGTRIYLDYIRLQVTAAGSNGTNVRAGIKIDKNTSRYTSGGTALTPINACMDSTASSSATVYFGAVVAAAASGDVRLLNHGLLRSVINVVGDSYLFVFGHSQKALSSMIVAGTAIANIVVPCAPVVIGPEQMFLLHMAAASQSAAASYEVECGFWER